MKMNKKKMLTAAAAALCLAVMAGCGGAPVAGSTSGSASTAGSAVAPVASPSSTVSAGIAGDSGNYITEEQARAAALEHAGVAEADAQFLSVRLDYDDGRTAMLVAVPREGTGGLDALMASMDKDTVPGWLKGMTEQQVGMVLPRFSMEYRAELKEVLSGMGMTDAFDPDKADFSGLTEREPVFIGQVIHQTALEVGEKGTRAAAATAVEILCGSAMNVLSVGADRPFFCAVVDKPTGALLFAAAVTDPKPLA